MARTWDRRTLLADLGRVTLGVVMLGTAACAAGEEDGVAVGAGDAEPTGVAGTAWRRVSLGFVSAYLLVRDSGTVVVDTGVEGSEGAIAEGLTAAGSAWADVSHVVLTHRHPDHVGSLAPVLDAAAGATAYAGAPDIPAITSSRPLQALADGDEVAGLEVVATPGHTAGHISLLDRDARLLVAGDALNGGGATGVVGPDPQYSEDHEQALASAVMLGGLRFDTVVFGHGDPLVGDASAAVAALAEDLR